MQSLEVPTGELVLDAVSTGPEDGRLVVLLHGFPQDAMSWRGVWPALVGAGCRVVAPDQRGYSPRARPVGVGAYTMSALVGDALALLDHLGAEQADVVGHDWGAAVAWQLAARHPDRVRTLTAVSVPHPLAFVEALRTDADQRARSQYMRDWKDEGGAEQALLDDDARGLREVFGHGSGADVDRYVARMSEPGALTAALSWYRAQSLADVEGLQPVRVPTVHVWSDDDKALGRAGAEGTAAHVTGPYRLEVFEGVSHWVPEQAPDRLAAVVLDQLAAHA